VTGSATTLPARGPTASVALDGRSAVRGLLWGVVACLALSGLTLLVSSQPTYDPWAWIVWGREVVHLDLSTSLGPSWKPLPVLLTSVFALFGGAAPGLWVLVARAGALAAVLCAFRLGSRLAGSWAGAIAAVTLLVAPWHVRNAALANSEGLQVAFALAAVERALAGRWLQGFGLSIGLGLLRPEAWPFIGVYGAFLVWRRRRTLPVVAAGLGSLPVLWLVPEQLGSGDWLRAAHRAQQPVSGTPADADSPVVDVLREGWSMLGSPIHWAFGAALAVVLWRRDRRLLALAGLIGAWTLLVAVMSAGGYSGNTRYLIVPAALAVVVAVAGLTLGARIVAGRIGVPGAVAPIAGIGLAAAFVAPWIAPTRRELDATRYQARLVDELGRVVDHAGGARPVRSCGPVTTGAYLVPAVAWELGLHLQDVRLVPEDPGTTLRVHSTARAPALPTLSPLGGAPIRTLAHTHDWRIVTTCGARA